VIATKVQDTLSVAPWLSRLVGKNTVLLLLQNGIDGVNLVRTMVGDNSILPSVVYINAERRHADLIVHHFGAHLEIPACAEAERLKLLMAGGVDIHPQDDFTTAAWRKLIINIAVNPITALTAQRFGVFAVPEIRSLAAGLIREAAAVGNASGAHLPDGEVEKIIAMCGSLKPQGGTSMLFDRLKGNRLEVEHLTGTIVRLARSHGIGVPLNTAILALLTAVDQPKSAGLHMGEEDLRAAAGS
jgi:2-dehydropantoate 2-reductase